MTYKKNKQIKKSNKFLPDTWLLYSIMLLRNHEARNMNILNVT